MPIGPGKYDDLATHARKAAGISDEFVNGGIALIVIGGNRGTGFSVQADPLTTLTLPAILRAMADEMESTFRAGGF
ncbi:MAG TPA: hypothetical protein VH539_10340 [Gemmatimonadaceae bacterium]